MWIMPMFLYVKHYTCRLCMLWIQNFRLWCAISNFYKQVATDVVQEQCEADGDTSIQQRVLMGAGTAIQGTGETLCEEGEGNQDMKIAGGLCKEFAHVYNYTTSYMHGIITFN